MEFDWLEQLVAALIAGTKDQSDKLGGVKIVDFSEVPSDMLPLIISLVAKLVFSIQQWTPTENRHPIALFCDEAHLYIPERQSSSGEKPLRWRRSNASPKRDANTASVLW